MDPPLAARPLVLLVDDDVRTSRTLGRMLREDGYDVEFASDGVAAMGRLALGRMPDVLVTDMTMPFADGVAVTRYARARSTALPVFIVTGYPLLVTVFAASIDPTAHVLTKPLDYDSFSTQLLLATQLVRHAQILP